MKINSKLQFNPIDKWLWYNHNVEQLTDDQIAQAKEIAGEYWWSDNDEIVMLTIEKDNTYLCEKRKKTWSYRNGMYAKTIYDWTAPTPEEAGILRDKLLNLFEGLRIERLKKETDKISGILAEEYNGLITSFRGLRTRMLLDTDWSQLADAPLSDEDKALYRKFRQYLRDMPEDPAWLSNDVFSVDFPITPKSYLTLDPDRTVEYMSVPEHFENQAALRAKFGAARVYKYLNLPGLVVSEDEWENSSYTELVDNLNKYLKKINSELEVSIKYIPKPNDYPEVTGQETDTTIDDLI